MRLYLLIVTVFFCAGGVLCQSKVYFDKSGKAVRESQAYYYRINEGESYKSYYVHGGGIYFEGSILSASSSSEEKNVYQNTCKWYHKNGSIKAVRSFNSSGQEHGLSIYYYESGKKWKEITYVNGVMAGNRYKEYNEDGKSYRIFEEDFDSNKNDWDVYISDKSAAVMSKGVFTLTSFVKDGSSRYISVPIYAADFSVEVIQDMKSMRENDRAGILYGFKDWQNYSYFVVTQSSFYLGHFYEGVHSADAEGMFTTSIVKRGKNMLKILSEGKQLIFSINGEIQLRTERPGYSGSNVGVIVGGKTTVEFDKLIVKEIGVKDDAAEKKPVNAPDEDYSSAGTGLIISKSGYVITNHYAVERAGKIQVERRNEDGTTKIYSAVVVQQDKETDLAILKITDDSLPGLPVVPFVFKEGGVEVGSSVFSVVPGADAKGAVKVTDGQVKSKTGYNNAVSSFETTIAAETGKGAPVFTDKGELAGFIHASARTADSAAFVIKLNYIKNLMELLPERIDLSAGGRDVINATEEQVKAISKFIVSIKTK